MHTVFPRLTYYRLLISGIIGNFVAKPAFPGKDSNSLPSIFDSKLKDEANGEIDLKAYRGKKILIVNTASRCSFTRQYKDLQQLQDTYKSSLVILAFPCNDFGKQEQENDAGIAKFCEVNFGITFRVMKKIGIRLNAQSTLYNWLTNPTQNGWNRRLPQWNFWKYLLDENGRLIACLPSAVEPGSKLMHSLLNA